QTCALPIYIGSRLRKLIESETEGIDKQTGAPNQNNLVMLLKQLFQAGKSLYFILASRIGIFDAQIINKMMNYAIELAGRGLGRADRHFTVELPGICRNNFSFVMLGYPQAQFCFADCGGSYNADKGFRMTVVHQYSLSDDGSSGNSSEGASSSIISKSSSSALSYPKSFRKSNSFLGSSSPVVSSVNVVLLKGFGAFPTLL